MLWWFHYGRWGWCWRWWHEKFLFLFLLLLLNSFFSNRVKLHRTLIHHHFIEIHFLHLLLFIFFLHFCLFDAFLSSTLHFLKLSLIAQQTYCSRRTFLSHHHFFLRFKFLTQHTSRLLWCLKFFRKEACNTICYRTCNIS